MDVPFAAKTATKSDFCISDQPLNQAKKWFICWSELKSALLLDTRLSNILVSVVILAIYCFCDEKLREKIRENVGVIFFFFDVTFSVVKLSNLSTGRHTSCRVTEKTKQNYS